MGHMEGYRPGQFCQVRVTENLPSYSAQISLSSEQEQAQIVPATKECCETLSSRYDVPTELMDSWQLAQHGEGLVTPAEELLAINAGWERRGNFSSVVRPLEGCLCS